ncbi:MAG: tetratricopeptide repeat protein, partial [Pyrinomonadaceae bacterium]
NFELEKAQQYAEKAFELRDRVSEHERFYISEKYENYISGDVNKTIEVLQAWAKTYPNDYIPHTNLSVNYSFIGRNEDALTEALEAARLDPNNATAAGNVIESFIRLNRFDEAKQTLAQLQARYPESRPAHFYGFAQAFFSGDSAAMDRELQWARGKPFEPDFLGNLSAANAYSGQLRKSEDYVNRAVEMLRSQDRKENESQLKINLAVAQGLFGRCDQAKTNASAGLALSRGRFSIGFASLAFAICNEVRQAQLLIDEGLRLYPKNTAVVSVDIPNTKAQLELNRNNAPQAIEILDSSRRYDLGLFSGFWNNYLRGMAYLQQRSGNEAIAEFQTILDHRGVDVFSPLFPLAHLGLARAAALAGDTAKSRTAYQNFFAVWKEADADLPILIQAKKEYEHLSARSE